MLVAENLVKLYQKANVLANDNISLQIQQGEIFGFLGPNGAGKTTFLKQVMGLIKPTRGNLTLFDYDIVKDSHLVPHFVSFMAQKPTALADLTVKEALSITGHLRGMKRSDASKQGQALAEELELENIYKRTIGKLSGGQQRMVAFAISLMAERPLLILDEPTNDLDPVNRKKLWDKLGEINRTKGTTIILVTHNVNEAEKVLKRVAIINNGKLTAQGTIGELKSRVEQKLRLEVIYKDGIIPTEEQKLALSSIQGDYIEVSKNQYLILVDSDKAQEKINNVMSNIGLKVLDDFKISGTSLEDVYLKLGGGVRLEN